MKLTHSVSPLGLFGDEDRFVGEPREAWCIAKIIRLVGPIEHPEEDHPYKKEFERAEELAIMNRSPAGRMKLITRVHWRKESEDIPDPPVPSDLLDFIESILVMDPERRPSAAELLVHPYLQS